MRSGLLNVVCGRWNEPMKIWKKLLAAALVLCILCALAPVSVLAASEYRATLSASAEFAEIGDIVTVDIAVSSGKHDTFNAFYAFLSFDPSMFSFDSRLLGSSDFAVEAAGKGQLSIIRIGNDIALSDKAVLSIPFRVVGSGSGSFTLSSVKIDVAGHAEKDAPAAAIGNSVTVSVRGGSCTAAITVSRTSIKENGAFTAYLVLNGIPNSPAPSAATLKMRYYSATCEEVRVNPALTNASAVGRGGQCTVSYSGFSGYFNSEGQLWLVAFTFSAETEDVLLELTAAVMTDEDGDHGIPFEEGASRITVEVKKDEEEEGSADTEGLDLESTRWDGITVDVSWYFDNPNSSRYSIDTAAKLAGAAALINGLVNTDCKVYTGNDVFTAEEWNNGSYVFNAIGSSGSNNKSTNEYHFGITRFDGVTLRLEEDLDMRGGNYMPLGGQYLMSRNDDRTKVSASFCGFFDGQEHNVTVSCDRQCTTGNYGDGQSIGLIGLLGVHDNEISEAPHNAGVCDVAVYGSVVGNRSVGGVVGKVGKTANTAVITRCANLADITGSDSKGVGGICGSAWNDCEIRDCYNRGRITNSGSFVTGGIVGSCEGPVVNCYNAGIVRAGSASFAMGIGTNNGGAVFTNCWYLEGSAPGGGYYTGTSANSSGAMSEADMKKAEFVETLGSAFSEDNGNINDGYPVLKWQDAGKIAVTGVSLNKTELTLTRGESETLIATVSPPNASNKNVTWESSDPSVATVDQNGKVTAVKAGTATITVKTEDGGKTASCVVTVKKKEVTGIALNKSVVHLTVDNTETLIAIVEPEDADDVTIIWSSSDESIATVDQNGKVTALAVGEATITARVGDYSATCIVSVEEEEKPVERITLDKTELTIEVGESVYLIATIEPEDATNAEITWTSSDPGVATVNALGKVTGISEGTAIITATAGDKSASCVVTVKESSEDEEDHASEEEIPSVTEYDEKTGKATVTPEPGAMEEAAETANENSELIISADIPDDANVREITVILPDPGLEAVADSGASLKIETSLSDLRFSHDALDDLAGETRKEAQIIIRTNDDGSVSLLIEADGRLLRQITGGVRVMLPAAKAGQVVVLIHEDGTKEVIQKSLVENGYAYVLLDGSATICIEDRAKRFVDVADDAWYKNDVDFVSSHELFVGISETEFGPNLGMTRAMMATVLYRLENEPETTGSIPFEDVASGKWYSEAILWASQVGIINGYGNGKFGPNDPITREQMAVMLHRYAKLLGLNTSAKGKLIRFRDGNEVSDWAEEAMRWAVGVGLFRGDDTGALNPKNAATRAEVAALFERIIELIVK